MKQGWKHFIMGASTMAVLMGGLTFAANRSETIQRTFRDIKIKLNGSEVIPKDANGNIVEPFLINGTTYLPVRAVGEAMGLNVDWDGETSTVKLTNSISIVDGVDYTDGYYKMFRVKLPKIVGNTKTINELNERILSEVLPRTYEPVAAHAIIEESLDKGIVYDYQYVIKNNVLVVYIYSSIPEGGSPMPSTGGGEYQFSYYYDIANDEILSLSDAVSKLSLSLDGLPTEELDESRYQIIIDNNELKLQFVI